MRLGVVSDLHGQEQALRQALTAMGEIDRLICLGDSISQAQFSNETVASLRRHDALTIIGNHEEAFLAGTGRNAANVDPDLVDWLAAQPPRRELELAGRRLLLVHSTPWASNHAYVTARHRDFGRFGEAEADIILYGHTHEPVVKTVQGTLIVNPGSAGEGRPIDHGFVRSCAVVDVAAMDARIIDLPDAPLSFR